MPDESAIADLVVEVLESGLSAEEVCANAPELLVEVRRRLRRVQTVSLQIDGLFPSSASASERIDWARLHGSRDQKLPNIPGYDVEEILGRGGMGIVYRGRHLKLNRTVAIKMLLFGVYASTGERARFLHEAEA